MTIRKSITRLSALTIAALVGWTSAYAQSYYDDDIYYDARKTAKKEKKNTDKQHKQQPQEQQYYYDGANYVPWNNVGEYQSADTYQPTGTSTRDVDEYNRHTPSKYDPNHPDSITLRQFEQMSNTRNLARFHDSEVAKNAYADNAVDDPNYAAAGAAPEAYGIQPSVSINFIGSYYDPFYASYYNPWRYSWWGYDPVLGYNYPCWGHAAMWGPSWSWGLGWGVPNWGWNYPMWGWTPGWGPSWGWGPGWDWGPGWGPGWGGGHHHTWTSSGAFAPNRTPGNSSTGNYRPNGNPNSGFNANGTRGNRYNSLGNRGSAASSNGTRGSYSGSGAMGTERPGYRQPTARPGSNSSVGGSYSAPARGRAGYSTSGTSDPRQSFPATNSSSSRGSSYSTPSYNNSSRGSSYSTGGSRGGYSGGGSYGGGASRGSSGGGGGTRGRGR